MTNQFQTLQNWTREILEAIKKEIKTDHIQKDPVFYRAYFGNRPQNRLTSDEIFQAYEKELTQGNEELAEWVVNRWVFKHGDLYQLFAERLSEINPNFDELEQLTEEQSDKVLSGAVETYGAIPTFLFVVLNGVVFPQSVIDKLKVGADSEKAALMKSEAKAEEQQNMEKVLAAHQREITRLHEKIAGVQKKYTVDTEALKKQIKALQKKLNG